MNRVLSNFAKIIYECGYMERLNDISYIYIQNSLSFSKLLYFKFFK